MEAEKAGPGVHAGVDRVVWVDVNGLFKTVPPVTVPADFTGAINKTGTVRIRDLYFACICIDFADKW